MNKTYHFEIPNIGCELYVSDEYDTIEECVSECKDICEEYGVDYNDPEIRLFYTDDFGETYNECTEEGELAG